MIWLCVKPLHPGARQFVYCYQHLWPHLRGGAYVHDIVRELAA